MFLEQLKILKTAGLYRQLKDRTSPQGTRIKFDKKYYINFASNDYLGLANHPHITDQVLKTLKNYGFGSGASRLLGGGSSLHKELEETIVQFKGTDSALLFNSGYAANTGIIPSITEEDSVVFSDELNHASIVDGCRLSKAKTVVYKHKDISHLEYHIKKEKIKKKIIATDSIFSMDGDIAPLPDICGICQKYNALLYIDDAHGTGVIGNGKGVLTHFRIEPEPWIMQMGTFSKALGSYGGFVTGSKVAVEWIINNARSFIFSTALPACVVAASLSAIQLLESDTELIKKLWDNREKAARGIKEIGYDILESETPIIPLRTGSVENTLRISSYLFRKGIFAPAIRPPTVRKPMIRITVTAAHTDEDIKILLDTLNKIANTQK